MSRTIVLDSGPVGLLTQRAGIPVADECKTWFRRMLLAGTRFVLPEIVDYEVRRELLRLHNIAGIQRLDVLGDDTDYLEMTTSTFRRAAELWAEARQKGKPTAAEHSLDIDVILCAQTLLLNDQGAIVATTNLRHVGQFVTARLWTDITVP